MNRGFHLSPTTMSSMSKHEKSEVDFSPGMLHSHCGPTFHDDKYYCRHFTPNAGFVGKCDVVEGPIRNTYWCELYKRVAKSS